MSWKIKETEEFEYEFEKLSSEIKKRFEKQFSKVRENPYGLGKTLSCPWFRELKNDKFRAYYLIYGEKIIVLFVSVSDKKNQQAFIDKIKNNFVAFKELVENEKNLNDKHFVGVK